MAPRQRNAAVCPASLADRVTAVSSNTQRQALVYVAIDLGKRRVEGAGNRRSRRALRVGQQVPLPVNTSRRFRVRAGDPLENHA